MKTKNTTNVCASCSQEIGEFIAVSLKGELICESCEQNAWDHPCSVITSHHGEIKRYRWCEMFGFRDAQHWENSDPNGVSGFKYVSTDGWRGYWDVVIADGYTTLASGWSTGIYYDVSHKHGFNNLVENIQDGTLECPYELIFAFGLTSNVFSLSSDVIIRESDIEDFSKWLVEKAGLSIEELQSTLN
jgi:hypothetical protein